MLKWLLLIGIPLLDLVAVVRAIIRGHGVEGTIAWVLAIIAFPGVGASAYLLLASPNVARTTRRKIRAAHEARRVAEAKAAGARAGTPEEAEPLFVLADSLTGFRATGGNAVRPFVEDADAFTTIEKSLEGAKRSIRAEYYMVRNDATGRRFLDLLVQKARQGLDVKFIHDAVGSAGLDGAKLDLLHQAGGESAAFLPLNPLKRRWAIHLRNHKKLVIVDDEVAFTGGMNVGDEYSGRSRRRGEQFFRDTHLEIRGPAVGDLAVAFAEDWHFATERNLDLPGLPSAVGEAEVAILPSGPDQEWNASAIIFCAAAWQAGHRLWIESPYFIPDQSAVQALMTAALRGVDVRIILPAKSDVRLARAAARANYRALLSAGVRIFEYQPSMLHAKTLVADSRLALVGSANCDFRSFRLNFELGALVADRDFAAALEGRFEEDQRQSRPIELADVERRGLPLRFFYGCVRLFSPLL